MLEKRVATVELVRKANQAAIDGKLYAPHIEATVARLPRLSMDEINKVWAQVNGRSEKKLI